MHQAAVLHRHPVTWIVVADSTQAQIYDYRKTEKDKPLSGTTKFHYYEHETGHALMAVPDGHFKAETIDDYQIGHQRRGTSVSSVGANRTTYEPTGNTEEELKHRFARALASYLREAHTDKHFDRLILAAPAKIIGELRTQLPDDIRATVAAEVSKDLMGFGGRELLAHLQPALVEAKIF